MIVGRQVEAQVDEMSGFKLGSSFKKYAIGATMIAGGAYALSRSPAVRTTTSNMTSGITTKTTSLYKSLTGRLPWAKKVKTKVHDVFHKTVRQKAIEKAGIRPRAIGVAPAPPMAVPEAAPKPMGIIKPLLVGGGVLATVLALKG